MLSQCFQIVQAQFFAFRAKRNRGWAGWDGGEKLERPGGLEPPTFSLGS